MQSMSRDFKEEGIMSGEYPSEATYNKLVRDKIPSIIEADGLRVETKKLSETEIIELLKQKAAEEGQELAEAKEIEDVKKEMADVLEVLQSLAEKLQIEMSEIELIRQERAKNRGRFQNGVFLERTYKENK